MLTDINEMPADARVWVYQCNRELTGKEAEEISQKAAAFTEGWTAHKQNLRAACTVLYNRFLILMIDEKVAMASGCTIDSSVHFVKSLEKEYGVSFFDRMIFAYKSGDKVEALTKNEFEKAISAGRINDATTVFNNLVQTKQAFDSEWETPLKNSWHKQLLAI
jgi:hypothetical protein